MKTSEQIDLISAAIVACQAECGHANFDSKNPHFKSKYASLAEVIDTAKPVLAKHQLAVLQLPGYRQDIGPVLCTRILHASGQWIEEEMILNPIKNDPQGIGSALTYMRRYSIPGVTLMASEEDDDGNAACVNHNIDTLKKNLSSYGSVEQITAYWQTLRITKTHPQYAQIVGLFTEARNKLQPAANNGKAA
jgi:hypothetical protein